VPVEEIKFPRAGRGKSAWM